MALPLSALMNFNSDFLDFSDFKADLWTGVILSIVLSLLGL